MKLKEDITRRLGVYDQAFSFVEGHGFAKIWPIGSVVLTKEGWCLGRAGD